VVSMLFDIAGHPDWSDGLKYAIGAFFAMRASIDYYKKMVGGDNGWW
jgi:hypothetical protein